MNALRTFRLVPLPTPPALLPALAFWCVWWLADMLKPDLWGHVLAPIALGLLARQLLYPLVNLLFNDRAQRTWQASKGFSVIAIFLSVSVPVAALVLGNDRIAQIAHTVFVAWMGLSTLYFVFIQPNDLHRLSTPFDVTADQQVGVHTILAFSQIGLAVTSAALIGLGADAIWVALMSLGAVIYNLLTHWIIVLWLLSRDDTER